MKKLIIALIYLLIVASCIAENALNIHKKDGYTNSQLAQGPAGSKPVRYVPNQIIVKFHRNIADTIEMGLAGGAAISELELSGSLDKLHKKYRVTETEAVFKNFRKQRQRIRTLLKKDKTLLTKRERRILRRLRRAPKAAKVPELDRIYRVEVELESGQSLEDVEAAYNNDPGVEYAGLNYIVSINAEPNDPLYPYQWPLNNTGQVYPESGQYNTPPGTVDCDIDAPDAWDVNTGDPEVVVAVLDTGVDRNHRDLQNNMWFSEAEFHGQTGVDDDGNGWEDDIYGMEFCEGWSNDPSDDNGHGTHCAGIIAAVGDNGLDITGVCWNATILPVKCLDEYGSGWETNAALAINYAVDTWADVISMSFGGGPYYTPMKDAIDYAYSQGVIVVASAGNDNSDSTYYPACYDHVIAVAATNSNDQKASFSDYGDWVDIAAPGVDVLSLRADGTSRGTVYDDYTTIMSGTSMSCPYVSGVIALMLSRGPELSTEVVTSRLLEAADDISDKNPGYEGLLGSGRLNAFDAAGYNSEGIVVLDNDLYMCDDIVGIQVLDADLVSQGSQQVTVTTDAGDEETLTLIQDANKPWIFAGTIDTCTGSIVTGNGVLDVSHGQIITATYNDANDGSGSPVTVEAFATIDCQSPVVSNVQMTDISCTSAKITFETDEPATASVHCGLTCGSPYTITDGNSMLTTSHTFYLAGLASETDYYFVIDAIDAAGNQTIDSNGGECYSFTTNSPLNVPDDFLTIQAAINAAVDGDIVIVEPNTYTGPGNQDIDFNGLAITVRSIKPDDSNIVAATIIDCNGTQADPHRGFYFHSDEGPDSVLEGFTIINGYQSLVIGYGGGIYCDSNATIANCVLVNNSAKYGGAIYTGEDRCPTIINCQFIGNSAGSGSGGGLRNYYNNTTVINCTFTENSAGFGGGIENNGGNPTVTNCRFIRNLAGQTGGGIHSDSSGSPIVVSCSFTGNSAKYGGGIYGDASSIINCIFSSNSATNSGGGTCYFRKKMTNCTFYGNTANDGGGIWTNQSGLALANSILWGNSDTNGTDESAQITALTPTVEYCCIQGWTGTLGGTGNIGADPCFADPNNGDYHLKSRAGRWYPSIYTDLDPTGDSFIDLSDFAVFATFWHKQGFSIPADLDSSGVVDLSDLKLLLDNYLMSYPPRGWVFDDVNSPCIDAGDPNSDWTAELWPHGKHINMGVYGGTPQASMSLSSTGNIADLNYDDAVDYTDMMLFTDEWLCNEVLLPEDLDRNGFVNFTDFAVFADNWLWEQ